MSNDDTIPHLLLTCWSCRQTFLTANDRSTHHLDAHERPRPVNSRALWQALAPLADFQPPNWKAQAASDWYRNGVTP